jgi:hypothetical protein
MLVKYNADNIHISSVKFQIFLKRFCKFMFEVAWKIDKNFKVKHNNEISLTLHQHL